MWKPPTVPPPPMPDLPLRLKTINRLSVFCTAFCGVGLMLSMSDVDVRGRDHIFSGVQRHIGGWFRLSEEDMIHLRDVKRDSIGK